MKFLEKINEIVYANPVMVPGQPTKKIYVNGIIKEATGHFLYAMHTKVKGPVFVVCENEKRALELFEALKDDSDQVLFFAANELTFENYVNYDFTNRARRWQVIKALIEGQKPLIITYPKALQNKLSKRDLIEKARLTINFDSEIDLADLAKKLIYMGYQRRSIVEAKGEFAIRGDIIDIFQVQENDPTRIELFDVEVDSMRAFDVNTQKSINNLDEITIYPVNEIIIEDEEYDIILEGLEKEIDLLERKFKARSEGRIASKFSILMDTIRTNRRVDNQDLVSPYLKQDLVSILDHLSPDSLIIYEDMARIIDENKDREDFLFDLMKRDVEDFNLFAGHFRSVMTFDEIISQSKAFSLINLSMILRNFRLINFDEVLEIKTIEAETFHNSWDDLINTLKTKVKDEQIVMIFTADKEKSEQLYKKLYEEDLLAIEVDEEAEVDKIRPGIYLLARNLQKGFSYPEKGINLFSYYDIFGKQVSTKKRSKKIINNRDLINYTDLEIGDLVVHENYGVGKYVGLSRIEVNGTSEDFIEVIYRDSDKLYIPTGEMDLLSKFIASGEKEPKLSKLNSIEWKKTKTKAKKALDKIAENLVELYAKRAKMEGHPFSKDTPWQREFEDSFIYQETNAQLRAISEIKSDMELNKPMDRLLCGDVGYGKTEVALRAAFKACMDGKQVVMIAPTTILVKQHFKTMRERFKNFPINIDFLSRFKTPAAAKELKRKLAKGEVDFVVGTHALLAESVRFKDLGLLIVDEEQRFGVKHKEKIKEMSEDIDVLTLSATPIPRTLQMSLSGIREMSLLDEHPENRLPINTYVMEFNPTIIREAILRELNRDGQIYFVYNRVNSIFRMKAVLEKIVPDARIAVSHGQMSTRELENILEDFINGEYDILLSTTIIETGMDIQNVNTIIIYNADKMGLSQLYQLKGRIGRSDRTAYAYFTYEPGKQITEISEKRLKAIKDFNELGSGYKIAMRDLELRGAGNLLGESQSGHIEAIGYDLYVKMLKESIDSLKGIKPKLDFKVKIDYRINAFLPDSYIEDQGEKINMYKKISLIENEKEYREVIDELIDRFGDIPFEAQNILDLALIKALMYKNRFFEMTKFEHELAFRYNNIENFGIDHLEKLSKTYKGHLRFDLLNTPTILIGDDDGLKNSIRLMKLIDKIKGENNEEK